MAATTTNAETADKLADKLRNEGYVVRAMSEEDLVVTLTDRDAKHLTHQFLSELGDREAQVEDLMGDVYVSW